MKNNVAKYLPRRVLEQLQALSAAPAEPSLQRFDGAVLFTDITGFSRLTDQYDKSGPEGFELLADILNAYFGSMTDVAIAHGGDVVDFVGDAIVVVWPAGDDAAGAIEAAVHCGLAMQSTLAEVVEATDLAMEQRIYVNSGALSLATVGGDGGRWHWLVAGRPMTEAGSGYAGAKAGEVLVCRPAWEWISDRFDGRMAGNGHVVVSANRGSARIRSAPVPPPALATPEAGTTFLPTLAHKLATGKVANWIGEFRFVTTLFVHFRDIDLERPDGLGRLQQAVNGVQSQLTEYGGSFERLSMDDKGITALSAFGLPFMAHEDDAVRALLSAIAIQQSLREAQIGCSIGITRGRVYCGDCGGETRRHFALVGDSIVLAARLMMAGRDTLYCDEATMQSARHAFEFSEIVSVQVKGKEETAPAYIPGKPIQRETAEFAGTMVDREKERQRLSDALKNLVRGEGACLVVSGEPGIGKSRLLAETADMAERSGLQILKCAGTTIDSGTQYFPWRAVLSQVLLGEQDFDGGKAQRELERLLLDNPRLYNWIPLLNDIFLLPVADNEITREITGPARASSLHILITQLLKQFVAKRPTLLIADDLQWFDEASANLLGGLMAGDLSEPFFILAGTRPAEESGQTVSSLLEQFARQTLKLDALPQEHMGEFIAQKLGVRLVPEVLTEFVIERTSGHALYTEQLLAALQSAGLVEIRGERCRVTDRFAGADLASLPDTLKGVIVSHIDRLPYDVQRLLKTASILEHGFTQDTLGGLLRGMSDVDKALRVSLQDGLLVEIPGSKKLFRFHHAVLRDVIYGLLPYAQRRELHSLVAASIEDTPDTNLEVRAAELARHWEAAEDTHKAVDYLERAALYALKQNSNREAIRHLMRAYDIYGQLGLAFSDEKKAELEMLLGRAYVRLCDYPSSDRHFLRSAALLGWPMPASRLRLTWGLAGLLAWHLFIRLGMCPYSRNKKQRIRHAHLANVYVGLAESAYFNSRVLDLIYQQMLSVNFAERAQSIHETVVGLVSLATGFLQSGFYQLSAYYNRLSLSVAEKDGDPQSLGFALLLNAVNANTRGDWPHVQECVARALEIYNRLGDEFRWHQAASNLYHMHYLRGEFELSEAGIQECASRSSIRTLRELKFWLRCVELDIQLSRGEPKRSLLQSLRDEETEAFALAGRFRRLGLIALAHWRLGDSEEALTVADSAFVMIQENPPAPWYTTDAFIGLAEVYIEACEAMAAGSRKNPLWSKAGKVCKALRRFARGAPASQGRVLIVNGRYQWLRGKTKKAVNLWLKAIELADKYDNRFDRALALHELGKQDTPQAAQYRDQARQLFTAMGANYYLAEYQVEGKLGLTRTSKKIGGAA